MNRGWLAAALLAVVGPVNAADLSLERIMLSSGGVGYFEYEATVDGNATLNLDVPLGGRAPSRVPLGRRGDRQRLASAARDQAE